MQKAKLREVLFRVVFLDDTCKQSLRAALKASPADLIMNGNARLESEREKILVSASQCESTALCPLGVPKLCTTM
jgi:hypothetical protein